MGFEGNFYDREAHQSVDIAKEYLYNTNGKLRYTVVNMKLSAEKLQELLSRQDPVWTQVPTFWDEGPFLGNGTFGVLVYVDPQSGRLHLKPGRTDIYDNRPLEKYTIMDKQFSQGRLQLGPVEIVTRGRVTGCDLRLSLYDATLTGRIVTEAGWVELTAWIPREENALVLDLVPGGGETAPAEFKPMPAETPRQTKMRELRSWQRYRADYPAPRDLLPLREEKGRLIYEQPLYTSGSYTVCTERRGERFLLSAATSDGEGSAEEALSILTRLADTKTARAAHLAYWHELYSRAFLSVSDPVWENFYWMQIYKMACAGRAGGRIIDTMGPWCYTTSWPSAFWNLNVQLTYAPMIPTGLFDIARSLPDTLLAEKENLNLNIDPAYREGCYGIGTNTCRSLRSDVFVPGHVRQKSDKVELGNLSWALFVCHTLYRTNLDEEMLTQTILPLLAGAVKYYMHFLTPDEKKVLHLAPTESPEYLVVDEDTNYDLALLRWGLMTLIEEHTRLGGDERILLWRDTLDHLTEYPESREEGLLIARNTRLTSSHRHYSHLLAFYPLHLLDAKKKSDCERIRRSIAHWHSMPEELEGYSQTGAASMLAMMGDGNAAIHYLDLLMKDFVRPNTMYREEGGPVIETPLAAVSSVVDMLMQCYGGEISVFPACPERWKDASFTFFAEGGYTVSAARKEGKLQYVRIRGKRAGECRLRAPFAMEPHSTHSFHMEEGCFVFLLQEGDEALFTLVPEHEAVVFPVETNTVNIFGLNETALRHVRREAICEERSRGKIAVKPEQKA